MLGIIILNALLASILIGILVNEVFIKPLEAKIKLLSSKVQLYQAAQKFELY